MGSQRPLRPNAVVSGGLFDYAIYTSDDPDPSSSSGTQETSPGTPTTSLSTSSSPGTSSSTTAPSTAQRKPPIAPIAGGVVGGAALILAFLLGLMLARRARSSKAPNAPRKQEWGSPPADALKQPLILSKDVAPDAMPSAQAPHVNSAAPQLQQDDPGVAEQVRLLQAEVQQLRQRVEGSSTASIAGSDTASVGRSLSTMKREQTRALVEHAQGLGSH
ncbi:hypothetical protein B0H14DRAFT_3450749 [Mycena olivaceomarginata]|nr:hypothetical protein B0H14DRAFT_3450749 [Mycena olivaceomarginata]